MGKPYSDDLRERVVASIEAGHSRVKVAEGGAAPKQELGKRQGLDEKAGRHKSRYTLWFNSPSAKEGTVVPRRERFPVERPQESRTQQRHRDADTARSIGGSVGEKPDSPMGFKLGFPNFFHILKGQIQPGFPAAPRC